MDTRVSRSGQLVNLESSLLRPDCRLENNLRFVVRFVVRVKTTLEFNPTNIFETREREDAGSDELHFPFCCLNLIT